MTSAVIKETAAKRWVSLPERFWAESNLWQSLLERYGCLLLVLIHTEKEGWMTDVLLFTY